MLNFTEWLCLEKFTPHAKVQEVEGCVEATAILRDLMRRIFPGAQVSTSSSMVSMWTNDRSISFSCGYSGDSGSEQYPRLYIDFDWNDDRKETDYEDPNRSAKEPHNTYHYVSQQISKDTMKYAHGFLELFRELSKYAILLDYSPVGPRRASWYASIMERAGYEEIATAWAPKVLAAEINAVERGRWGRR